MEWVGSWGLAKFRGEGTILPTVREGGEVPKKKSRQEGVIFFFFFCQEGIPRRSIILGAYLLYSTCATFYLFYVYSGRYLVENFEKVMDTVAKIKSSGNHFFKQQNLKTAIRKYRKALKYINLLRDSMGSTR